LSITHLFVYGTLLPGDVRFHRLEPFVVDGGWSDAIEGRLFDTGQDFPAAIVDERAAPGGLVIGRTFPLLTTSILRALEVLDEVEAVAGGSYRRVTVMTRRGTTAWAYEYGDGFELTAIESGDWLKHRPPSAGPPPEE